MTAYRTPIDIGSRALQHLGSSRMDPVLGFNDTSVRGASEAGFAYDKLREAELRRRTWTFATARQVLRAVDTNTMLLSPAMWTPGTTYFTGSIVTDQSGNMWISNIPNNLANDPLLTTFWEPYFGPRSVSLWTATITYETGELVYTTAGDGKYRVYLSLQPANADTPGTATAWDATATYFKNQVVTLSAVAYMSLIDLNINNTPSAAPALFNIATTYAIGNTVGASDGVIYTSLANGNIGFDPTLDGGVHWSSAGVLNPWTRVFVGGIGSAKWLEIGGTEFPMGVALTTLPMIYPHGTGPSSQLGSKNIFVLPAGYLRRAAQNPKTGIGAVGGPTGVTYDDWLIERGYLITSDTGPIPLRFVANITDVSLMDVLFCEGIAAGIAFAICDTITQDKGQLQIVAKTWDEWKNEASVADGIENEYEDPPDDDWITVRL
jgi:hypothetical protein